MSALLLAITMLIQDQPQPAPQPPMRTEPMPIEASPANEIFYQEENRINAADARRALEAYGNCIAERNALVADSVLTMDFTTGEYRRRMERMREGENDCARHRGRLSFQGLGLAGAVAERLLERDASPLNVRLARAALGPAARTYSPTDRVAMCVVRSVPDQVAGLFASEVASAAETEAATALMPAVNACNQANMRFNISTAGARAMLATAAYRSLHGTSPAAESRD